MRHLIFQELTMQRLRNVRLRPTIRTAMILAVSALLCLTGALLLSGLLRTSGQVTAYGTVLLAIGTIGLAVGAIGTYTEQQKTNQQLEAERADRKTADIAQVTVERLSGPNEHLNVTVHNGSSRAITNVYVWADARGMKGHYHAGVHDDDGGTARGMRNTLHDGDLYWQLRVIQPGRHATFTQLTHMVEQPVAAFADKDITAYAEFQDNDGIWWRCDEDGNVTQTHPVEPPAPAPPSINPAAVFPYQRGLPIRLTGHQPPALGK